MVEYGTSPEGPRVSIAGEDGFLARRANGWSLCPHKGIPIGVRYDTR